MILVPKFYLFCQTMLKSRFSNCFSALFLFLLVGLSGCVTTTEIDEGDGIFMEEEPSLEDQVKVEN